MTESIAQQNRVLRPFLARRRRLALQRRRPEAFDRHDRNPGAAKPDMIPILPFITVKPYGHRARMQDNFVAVGAPFALWQAAHQGAWPAGMPALPGLSLRSRISPTKAGFALPLLSFITWPLRKLRAAVLPALKSAAGPGLAAMASSQNFSIAPASLTCARPFFSTILAGASPVANMSAKTSWAILVLIFPASTSSTSSRMFAGLNFTSGSLV